MSEKYTVVIPVRDEGSDLDQTIANIAETQTRCAAILVERDTTGAGTAATRHAGTLRAQTETVITIDAHMRFKPGSLDLMAEFLAEDRKRVCCLSCRTNPECAFAGASYWGADLYEWGGEYALEPKWSKNRLGPGEVACVMGACYGFSKAFYEALGSPWSLARGWGCDETLLSIPARLAGGSVHVLADECAHRLKTGADVGYRQSDAEISAIWYTRYLLLEYVRPDNLPELRGRMRRSASSPARFPKAVREAAEQLDKVRKLSWAEFAAEWLKAADGGECTRLAFDQAGSWSQKYNLVYDRLLELKLFPASLAEREVAFYRAHQNRYGLPLDSRADYTKLDWLLYCACLTGKDDDFQALLSPVIDFLKESPSRVPMTDWYETVGDGRQVGFQARSVVGGLFLRLLADEEVREKWRKKSSLQR